MSKFALVSPGLTNARLIVESSASQIAFVCNSHTKYQNYSRRLTKLLRLPAIHQRPIKDHKVAAVMLTPNSFRSAVRIAEKLAKLAVLSAIRGFQASSRVISSSLKRGDRALVEGERTLLKINCEPLDSRRVLIEDQDAEPA